ncbi:DEAD/DEAH box helicase [Neptuniibacter pectenicola]|uniref:DEAD/DEAH box helicase n=1 Tax=Neptuniibacter pectenicola TaxID=1806669 RepID=UPI0030ECB665
MNFTGFNLNPLIVEGVERAGYSAPTPIQSAAIPVIMSGCDLLAGARTGTGKTAAFALPLLHKIMSHHGVAAGETKKRLTTLVLVPTRELAQQVNDSFKTYAKGSDFRSAVVYGGVGIKPQIDQINKGIDLLVATPGRLLDLSKKRAVNLSSIDVLVFDEADRMLDMGFKDEIRAVMSKLPKSTPEAKTRQTLLFSATLNDNIYKFSKHLLSKPELIEVDQRNSASLDVAQVVYNCDPERKVALVSHLIGKEGWQQVLIFSRTKLGADQIAAALSLTGLRAEAIHADRSQTSREQALEEFKQGAVNVLVATDVAARGIDIQQLEAVINFEVPYKPEDYVHRIGRTGRAGHQGKAVTLLIEEENYLLEEIEVLLDTRLPQQWLEGFEPDLTRVIEAGRKNSKTAQKRRAKKRALGKR